MKSEWTISTLKEHFEKILSERDKAIDAALSAAKEAVNVAEANAEKWRTNANEWRAAMSDKDKLLMQRSEFVTYKEATEKSMQAEQKRNNIGEGRSQGYVQFIGWIVAIVSIVSSVILIISLQ